MLPGNQTVNPRRPDLDVLRVGAFFLLILYHLGMFYVPWGWHAKSTHILPQLELPMGLLNPWRLTLLFLVSGLATRFMSGKFAPGALAEQRSWRLGIPLLFGMLVIVPPQSWAEVTEKHGYTGGLLEFWTGHYLAFDQSFGIILPTYNHLWFVAYLWLYTLIAVALWKLLPALDRFSARALNGPGLLVIPTLFFGAYRAFLFPGRGETHIIWDDLYDHAHYATAFALGLVLARRDRAWAFLTRNRHLILAGVVITMGVALSLSGIWEDKPGWRGQLFALIRAGYAWTMICALMGYAHHHIRHGSPLLNTLSEAVFSFYIVHQTTIIVAGHFLSPYQLPVLVEAGAIFTATVVSCAAAYLLARAVPPLRLPLGLKP